MNEKLLEKLNAYGKSHKLGKFCSGMFENKPLANGGLLSGHISPTHQIVIVKNPAIELYRAPYLIFVNEIPEQYRKGEDLWFNGRTQLKARVSRKDHLS